MKFLEGNKPGFLLRELSIRSATEDYPPIDGIAPAPDPYESGMIYSRLKRPIKMPKADFEGWLSEGTLDKS
jgi:hypothetical protein